MELRHNTKCDVTHIHRVQSQAPREEAVRELLDPVLGQEQGLIRGVVAWIC